MKSFLKKLNWETGAWLNHFIFYLVGSAFFVLALSDSTKSVHRAIWLYYIATTIMIIFGSTSVVFFKSGIRYFIALTIVILNIFMIPLSIFAYTGDISMTLGSSMLFVIITIALSPNLVSSVAFAAVIAFGCFFYMENYRFSHKDTFPQEKLIKSVTIVKKSHKNSKKNSKKSKNKNAEKSIVTYHYKVEKAQTLQSISSAPEVYNNSELWELIYKANISKIRNPALLVPKGTLLLIPFDKREIKSDILGIVFSYILGVFVALCWKMLIVKMYQFYTNSIRCSSQLSSNEVEEVNEKLEAIEKEHLQLKEEVALQIIEMNSMLNAKKS